MINAFMGFIGLGWGMDSASESDLVIKALKKSYYRDVVTFS